MNIIFADDLQSGGFHPRIGAFMNTPLRDHLYSAHPDWLSVHQQVIELLEKERDGSDDYANTLKVWTEWVQVANAIWCEPCCHEYIVLSAHLRDVEALAEEIKSSSDYI